MHATHSARVSHALHQSFPEQVFAELETRLRKEQFDTWFRRCRVVAVHDDHVELAAPSGFIRDWLNRNFLATIEAAVTAASRGAIQRVKISQDPLADTGAPVTAPAASDEPVTVDLEAAVEPAKPAETPAEPGPAAGSVDRAMRELGVDSPAASPAVVPLDVTGTNQLNDDYTFAEFVVGPCNRLAHAAALAIGENPGRAYNPLFIHGNVGLGKTHLLQATCHAIRQKQGYSRVLYLSCEDFTNRFIRAIQNGRLDEFREFHRNIDVLVVDDIQFLANKEKTQDEFFHTFNALYNSQRQIVISSDRPPVEIPTIEERLVSRFKWGLVADMEVPCFETRVAIAKRKARSRGVDLPDDVAFCIAHRIDTNIRELEGAVIKVLGVATITDREIDTRLAEEALRGVALSRNSQVSLADVMSTITDEFSIPAREITGKSRTQAVSLPRQIGMFLSRELTEHSLEEVGRFFGNRDHTTVLYAVQKIKKRCREDRMFRELVGNLTHRMRGG